MALPFPPLFSLPFFSIGLRRYPLNHRIRSHFEFLFGDENYFRDLELQFMGGDSSFVLVADLIARQELGDMLAGVIGDTAKV